MPRYFLHLFDAREIVTDAEGMEIPADAVQAVALEAARDCMSADVRLGVLDLRCCIHVEDACGIEVHRLPFSDAVEVIRGA